MLRPPIFVLSHPDAEARRERITRELNDARLPHAVVPAAGVRLFAVTPPCGTIEGDRE